VNAAEMRAALVRACEELSPPQDRKDYIAGAVDTFIAFALGPSLPEKTKAARLRSYRPASRATSERQLERYAKAAEALAAAAEGFNRPACYALACVEGTPWRYEGDKLRERAARTRETKRLLVDEPTAPPPGRPAHHLANAVALAAITQFE
jgi:hypothetical protein